jgi:hypothetical protein
MEAEALEVVAKLEALVGPPGSPLPKLQRPAKRDVKSAIGTSADRVPKDLLLRAYVASNVLPPADLLQTSVIRNALNLKDAVRSSRYLTRTVLSLDAQGWLGSIREQSEHVEHGRSQVEVIRLIDSLARWFASVGKRRADLTSDASLEMLRLFAILAERFSEKRPSKQAASRIGRMLLIAIDVVLSGFGDELLHRLLQLARAIRRVLGDAAVESAMADADLERRLRDLKNLCLSRIPAWLASGSTNTLQEVGDDRTLLRIDSESFEHRVLEAWNEEGLQLPGVSRRWVSERFGVSVEDAGSVQLVDEGEKMSIPALAQLLLSAWRVKDDGRAEMDLFERLKSFAEQFEGLSLHGSKGQVFLFDRRVHEEVGGIDAGDSVRLVQPWVEHRGSHGVRIVARGLVEKV